MATSKHTVVTFGELLHRLDCLPGQRLQKSQAFRSFFTGAEANVAVLLAQLKIPVRFVSALPNNPIAELALHSLNYFGIETTNVLQSGDRIGVFYSENGNGMRPSRVIYDRKYSSFFFLRPGMIDWDLAFEGATWFHWSGISAALSQGCADTCLEALQQAKKRGLIISCDMNYRSSLWDYGKSPAAIMPGLVSFSQVLVGDVDTAGIYFGIKTAGTSSREEQFSSCCETLKKQMPGLQTIAMSFRGTDQSQTPTYQGALWQKGEYAFTNECLIRQTIDRIGSGDAFTGGLIYGLINGSSISETIDTALACGAMKHSMEGDFCIISDDDIKQFIQNGPVHRVIR